MEWKVYADNKTCYVFCDGTLVDRYTILKQQAKGLTVYSRGSHDKKETPPVEKMKLIASTTGDLLYDRTKGLHFHGLAKKVDEAGEIAFVSQLPPETVQSYRTMAKVCFEQAKICLSKGGSSFTNNARMLLIEIDKYDPENEEYRALLQTLV
ncbi:MAG: hypothetical protein NTW67_04920 [Candidatus Woesearchaeota archaeon]|nr:hypothetical protein [Candidatus Woesearchaeota archaeon]